MRTKIHSHQFAAQEITIILAGLRLLIQCEEEMDGFSLTEGYFGEIATGGGLYAPPTVDDIEQLCSRINSPPLSWDEPELVRVGFAAEYIGRPQDVDTLSEMLLEDVRSAVIHNPEELRLYITVEPAPADATLGDVPSFLLDDEDIDDD